MMIEGETLDIYQEWTDDTARHFEIIKKFLAGEAAIQQDFLRILYVASNVLQRSSVLVAELNEVLDQEQGKLNLVRNDKLAELTGEVLLQVVRLIMELGFDANEIMIKSVKNHKQDLTAVL